MDFRILGPLEVADQGDVVALADGKQRAVLAMLLLQPNEVVSSDRLIEALWGEQPPASAAKSLQVYVSRLRRSLEGTNGADGPVFTRAGGYLVRVGPAELDRNRFEDLVERGARALADDAPEQAAELLSEALALWRGPPLADFAYESFAQAEIGRLEELQLAALEQRIEADLALGRHTQLVAELEALVDRHPLREGLRRQLMLALYRSGRQTEALDAYREARTALVEELGIEPSQELRELESRILNQDAELDAPEPPRRSRVPAPLTDTIGRDEDIAAVTERLGDGKVRLLTLTGPGGVGKTRLALEAARRLEPELRDGAWFVSLAGTAAPEYVAGEIAQTLDLIQLKGETPDEAIKRFLAPKHALVVLDNFEHLLPAAPLLSDVLSNAPAVTMLATSREPLRLEPEQRYTVAPLAEAQASSLFVERAQRHDPAFEPNPGNADAIAEICRRLDGLPLAIELAAARTSLLGPTELNARLADALDALGSGPRDAPERQRTLRATIDWSHQLLSSSEANAFAGFAAFAGGATLEAAQEVTGADLETLERLIDKQLLIRRPTAAGAGRLHMLETVREYARERLDAHADSAAIRRRHCLHYLGVVERAEPQFFTREDAECLPRLETELDNLRAALEWSLANEPAVALRMSALLAMFWEMQHRGEEGLHWVEAALDKADEAESLSDRARALTVRVHLLEGQQIFIPRENNPRLDYVRAQADEALDAARQAGDPAVIADALFAVGDLDMTQSFPQRRRRELADEALVYAKEAGDARTIGFALLRRALSVPPEEGEVELEQAATALHAIGSSRVLAFFHSDAAYNAIKVGRHEQARPLLERAMQFARESRDPSALIFVCGNTGMEAILSEDVERARDAFVEELQLCRQHVLHHTVPEGLGGLAAVACGDGDFQRGARLLGAAEAIAPIGDDDLTEQLERKVFAPARRECGERAWTEAFEAGGRLSVDEAIAFALGPQSGS